MTRYMKQWQNQVLTATQEPTHPSEGSDFERIAIMLVVTQHGFLDATLQLQGVWPSLNDAASALLYDSCKELSPGDAHRVCRELLTGVHVNLRDTESGLWHCSECRFETTESEGPCSNCGASLEIYGTLGPAPLEPLPADSPIDYEEADEVVEPIPADSPLEPVPANPLDSDSPWAWLWRNYPVHNIIVHPLHELMFWFGLGKWAKWLHDATVPQGLSRLLRG